MEGHRHSDQWQNITTHAGLITADIKPYMSHIDVCSLTADVYDGQSNSFTSEPVPMVNLKMKGRERSHESRGSLPEKN